MGLEPSSFTPGEDPLRLQLLRNTETREGWSGFASHRQQVMQLLLQAAKQCPQQADGGLPRLMLWGAGNCNDLELPLLAEQFREVHLVDWDLQALSLGRERQMPSFANNVFLHGGMDLAPPISSHTLAALPTCEVVASVGLISQLLEPLLRKAQQEGSSAAQIGLLGQRMVESHVRQASEKVAPGGSLFLVADFVSSDTLPDLLTAEPAQLPLLLRGSLERGNFFIGLHPAQIHRAMAALAGQRVGAAVRTSPPWKWMMGPRAYGVVSFQLLLPAAK